MQIVAASFRHGFQQGAVDPIHDGSIELARTVEADAVLIEVGYENILDLQIAAEGEAQEWCSRSFRARPN